MPEFVAPPTISTYLLDQCEDACQIIVTFDQLILSLNQFLTDFYDWATSISFPNVYYDDTTGKLYYNDGTALIEIQDFPNIEIQGGLLKYKADDGTFQPVPASALVGNVISLATGDFNIAKVNDDGTTEPLPPYRQCVRYNETTGGFEYHDGATFTPIEPKMGAVFVVAGEKVYWDGSAYQPLPPTENETRAVFDEFSSPVGIDAYQGGTWNRIHTF